MSYEDAIECNDLTRAKVLNELRKHRADVAEFDREVKPDADGFYTGAAVLGWLGY